MYEKVIEQAESFFKPLNDIVALNMQALDKMREQQVELVNELFSDGIEYARDMSKPSMDFGEIISTQQSYFECIKNKLTSNAYSSYDFWSDVQGKSGELWQSAIEKSAKNAASAANESAASANESAASASEFAASANESAELTKKKNSAKKAAKKAAEKIEESAKAEGAPSEPAE